MTYVLSNAGMLSGEIVPGAAMRATSGKTRAAGRPSFWRRALDSVVESRARAAERVLRERDLLIGEAGAVLGGVQAATLSTDASLPFNR